MNPEQPSPAIVLSRLDLDRIESLLEREAPAVKKVEKTRKIKPKNTKKSGVA